MARFHQQYFLNFDDPIEQAAQHLKPFNAPELASLVAVRCSFSAFCEHHLLPFFGTAQVVYLPGEKITGLSKISRVITSLCSRPQIQERITSETGRGNRRCCNRREGADADASGELGDTE